MPLRRTPAGWSHGEAPAGPPFLTLRLKPGWKLAADGRAVTRGRKDRVAPELPAGAELVPAIPLPRAPRGQATAAEAELLRFVQLRLPPGTAPAEWLARVRAWEFVESVQAAPEAGLP